MIKNIDKSYINESLRYYRNGYIYAEIEYFYN